MLRDFNLLATTSRRNEANVCLELRYLLEEIGDSTASIDKAGVSGLVAVKTTFDPFDVIKKFRLILQERPYVFRYSLRIIPIEKVVHTTLEEIQCVAAELALSIGENETYRVTVEKRFTKISTHNIIKAAAANIERKVDLSKAEKILLIEVIGGLTGISVIKPSDILAIIKEKMR